MYTQLVRHSLLQPSHWVLSWFNTFTSAQLPSFEAISRHRSQRLKFDSWIELPSSSHDLGMFEQYCNFSEVEILSACNVMVSELFSRISHSIPSWLIYCLKKKTTHLFGCTGSSQLAEPSILVVAYGIFSCCLWTPSRGMWDPAARPGVEPKPLPREHTVSATGPQGSSTHLFCLCYCGSLSAELLASLPTPSNPSSLGLLLANIGSTGIRVQI